jgi:hypothetical protein
MASASYLPIEVDIAVNRVLLQPSARTRIMRKGYEKPYRVARIIIRATRVEGDAPPRAAPGRMMRVRSVTVEPGASRTVITDRPIDLA